MIPKEFNKQEEEYSDSSDVRPSRKRSRSLGEVLATFSGLSPHLLKLRRVYDEHGDSDEFETSLKKIKTSFVTRFKVLLFHAETKTQLPFLPGESIFFSREEAEFHAEKYIKMIESQGNYRFEIKVVNPGE